MPERLMKLLLIGLGGLLVSPMVAVGAWSVFGPVLGNVAIVFLTIAWFWALLRYVVRDRAFPIALSWEEEQRRKTAKRLAAVPEPIEHGA